MQSRRRSIACTAATRPGPLCSRSITSSRHKLQGFCEKYVAKASRREVAVENMEGFEIREVDVAQDCDRRDDELDVTKDES
jgi:hypothetical protein